MAPLWKEADGSNQVNTEIAASGTLPIRFSDARNPGGPFNELSIWNDSDNDIEVRLDGQQTGGKTFPVRGGDAAQIPKEDGTIFHYLVIENKDAADVVAAGDIIVKANRYDLVKA